MTDDELKQLIASNARAIEAASEERFELRQGMADIQQAILRSTDLQKGITNHLSRLDEDRPTLLQKLTTIEN